ncbi:MAG: NUDIX domain-containing protein [Methylobacteriaceae bacterium]|nr:NUDIX domain-containing protein [Methylobacteriaceae bacterium]MBV9245507.1 NUDIX domain-containing protein [Methylobacteriaceae bacterium]MBV9637618.1 NUDIX domain-containing protein [Methylobacteriaceae bacterium]MBV9701567.1 NUDIX domain-containing protein [Methylobacteriaceae bacterium]
MRHRPSSRLLILDMEGRLLLFRFEHDEGALQGQVYWATPGGSLGPGETYEDAACREMLEETGLQIHDPGPQVARRQASFQLPSGEAVQADERYFLIRVREPSVSSEHWTDLERQVIASHRWWPASELRSTKDQFWPENLFEILVAAGAWKDAG